MRILSVLLDVASGSDYMKVEVQLLRKEQARTAPGLLLLDATVTVGSAARAHCCTPLVKHAAADVLPSKPLFCRRTIVLHCQPVPSPLRC